MARFFVNTTAIFSECDCFLYRMQWVVWMSMILFRQCNCGAFLCAMSNEQHRISIESMPILCTFDYDSKKKLQSHIVLSECTLRFVFKACSHSVMCDCVFKVCSHSVMCDCVF